MIVEVDRYGGPQLVGASEACRTSAWFPSVGLFENFHVGGVPLSLQPGYRGNGRSLTLFNGVDVKVPIACFATSHIPKNEAVVAPPCKPIYRLPSQQGPIEGTQIQTSATLLAAAAVATLLRPRKGGGGRIGVGV